MFQPKKYMIEFGSSMGLYIITLYLSVYFINSNPDSNWIIFVSLLPILPIVLAFLAFLRALKTMDEMYSKIQLTSFSISFAIIGLVTFTYGFLELVGFPHIPYVFIFPSMILIWGLSLPMVIKYYK